MASIYRILKYDFWLLIREIDPQYKSQKNQNHFCHQIDFPAYISRETCSGWLPRTFRVRLDRSRTLKSTVFLKIKNLKQSIFLLLSLYVGSRTLALKAESMRHFDTSAKNCVEIMGLTSAFGEELNRQKGQVWWKVPLINIPSWP